MDINELIKICVANVPENETWGGKENYGPYNTVNLTEVQKVLYCVTATAEVEEYFREHNYDLLIAHHPMVPQVPCLIFHTALDCCEGGLNDQWRDHLEIVNPKHFDGNLGWYGNITPMRFSDLIEKVKKLSRSVEGMAHLRGDDTIGSIAICSGLGGLVHRQVEALGVDCYITGEMMCSGKNSKLKAIIETGHTNSEWMGVNLFKKLLEPHGVKVDLAPSEVDYFGCEYYNDWRNDDEFNTALDYVLEG